MKIRRMDKEIKALWLEALRSGNYKQGRICLYHPEKNAYCCLGVLANACEILQENGNIENIEGRILDTVFLTKVPILNEEVPEDVQRYLAACNDGAYYPISSERISSLQTHPDYRHPRTFPEIADWIEKYL